MPTYEYACRECGDHLEVVQAMTDDPLTTCPNCSGPLRKVFSAVGIAFKGEGFYKNDSRSSSGKKREGSEKVTGSEASKPADSPSTSTSTSKSESGTSQPSSSSADSGASATKSAAAGVSS